MIKAYICSPHRLSKINGNIAKWLKGPNTIIYLPQNICKKEDQIKDPKLIRHRCIEAIEDSDVFIVYLDEYGMDSAWELGYAEKAGKRIIGLSLDPDKLNTPKAPQPQTIWDHWMHGWKEHTIIKKCEKLYPYIEGKKVYISIPIRYVKIISFIEKKCISHVKKIYTPLNISDVDIRKLPIERRYLLRKKFIEAIEDSDVFIVYLDEYGMDSAWELGYAEKAGKRIIGLSLDPDKLNTPKAPQPQTIWDHWMHGWKEHTIIHDINLLKKIIEEKSSENFQIPVVCAIIEKYENDEVKILLQTRSNISDKDYYGMIEIPGGKIRKNETIIEALKREVQEECGLEVEPVGHPSYSKYNMHGSTSMIFKPFTIAEEIGDHPYIGIFVRCRVVGGHLQETSEGKNHRWVSIKELETLLDKKEILPIVAPGLIEYVKYRKKDKNVRENIFN